MIYIDGKPVIIACDNMAFVKKLPVIEELMADAESGCPYDGAREHYILCVDHRSFVHKVVKALLPVTPFPKKRKKTKKNEE